MFPGKTHPVAVLVPGLLEDATCAAFSCRAGPGPNCKQCRAAADRTARDQCEACNAGCLTYLDLTLGQAESCYVMLWCQNQLHLKVMQLSTGVAFRWLMQSLEKMCLLIHQVT